MMNLLLCYYAELAITGLVTLGTETVGIMPQNSWRPTLMIINLSCSLEFSIDQNCHLINNYSIFIKSFRGSVDLQEWSRCIGLKGANVTIWNKMFKKYQDDKSEDTLIYLACSESSSILKNFLNKTISDDSVIPEKHVLSVFKSVCLYPTGDDKRINLCLKFIDHKFDKIKLR